MSTKYLFFSGKGGVGKTSVAAATAVHHALEGRKTLIITTDPAGNLADVFEQEIGHHEAPIGGVPNLWAMEIDADEATAEYRERIIGPMRAVMPQAVIDVVEEQFDSPCTTEIAAFDRFVDFLNNPDYDVVVFDTAPTGHTIRLLELPVDWSKHIEESAKGGGQTCIGPVQSIQASKAKYDLAVERLRDPVGTIFTFVVVPEETPIAEAVRSAGELAALGIPTGEIIVNRVLPPEECAHRFFARRKAMQDRYLARIGALFSGVAVRQVPELPEEVVGLGAIRALARLLRGDGKLEPMTRAAGPQVTGSLIPRNGHNRLVFFTGKGGVGKTVASAATAVWLARQGKRTLLVCTDPASQVSRVLDAPVDSSPAPVEGVPHLWAANIDQKRAGQEYRQRILDEARGRYAPDMLQAMEEELRSPCTDEMAAFEEFLRYTDAPDYDVVVFDTAPTGHTLRLLGLPMAWEKQIDVMVAAKPGSSVHTETTARYRRIIDGLRDPDRTSFIFVVIPEKTPIVEALRARDDLGKTGIAATLVVANLVLPEEACSSEFFKRRRSVQQHYLAEISRTFGLPRRDLPLLPEEVRGVPVLEQIGDTLWSGL